MRNLTLRHAHAQLRRAQPSLQLWLKREHSLLALYPSESDTKLDRKLAFMRAALALSGMLWFSVLTAAADASVGISWLWTTILWSPMFFFANILLRHVSSVGGDYASARLVSPTHRRAQPRCRPFDWPYGFSAVVGVLLLWVIVQFAFLNPDESADAFAVFGIVFLTSPLVELGLLALRSVASALRWL